jgi:hypothetical protein
MSKRGGDNTAQASIASTYDYVYVGTVKQNDTFEFNLSGIATSTAPLVMQYWNGSTWAVGSQQIGLGGGAGQASQQALAVAVGYYAGNTGQGTGSVAIGAYAGQTGQGANSVAIGFNAGLSTQNQNTVAIGYQAGYTGQKTGSVAIGYQAGQYGLGTNSIAIGNVAGPTGVNYSNNILLNAQGVALNPSTGSALYVAPIRNAGAGATLVADTSSILFYNPLTSEITYASSVYGPTGRTGATGAQGD